MALLERPPVVDADAEALFKEARRRRRRRWLVGTCMVLVAASIAALVGLASQSPGKPTSSAPPKPRVSTPTRRPLVNVRAFSGLGRLAFVSRNAFGFSMARRTPCTRWYCPEARLRHRPRSRRTASGSPSSRARHLVGADPFGSPTPTERACAECRAWFLATPSDGALIPICTL